MADQGSAGTSTARLLLPAQRAVRQRFDPYLQLDAATTTMPKQQMGVRQPASAS